MLHLIAMIPFKARIVLFLGLAALFALGVFMIDQRGYNRCKAQNQAAIARAEQISRERIKQVEESYDRLRQDISRIEGDNPDVGPRTRAVLDRLPQPDRQ